MQMCEAIDFCKLQEDDRENLDEISDEELSLSSAEEKKQRKKKKKEKKEKREKKRKRRELESQISLAQRIADRDRRSRSRETRRYPR